MLDGIQFGQDGGDFSRRLLEFLSQTSESGDSKPETSALAKPLLHLIDTASKHLNTVRAIVAGDLERTPSDSGAVLSGKGFIETIGLVLARLRQAPESVARHYAVFAGEALRILEGTSELGAAPRDFRFRDALWAESDFFRIALQLYLSLGQSMHAWLDEQEFDPGDRRRIAFLFEQVMAAAAPSNLPLSPAALRRANATEGRSMVDGVRHMIEDAVHNRAMPRQISPRAYVVGKDFALTPGAVVYRNDQLELIQYAPQTAQVRCRPVLLIPAQINKFYCFDLRPENSFVAHAVRSGMQLFIVSWRNPCADHRHWDLDTYVSATIGAMDAVSAITGSQTMGLISACAGGLTAMATIGYLAARGEHRVSHHSLLVTCLFPNQGSDLELFVTHDTLERVRRHVQASGLMHGDALAKLFCWLRPTDLVWRYWINNYLLGKNPPPLDVLFWDNDSTRLPAALHSDFLDIYAGDVFRTPNALCVLGEKLDFSKLRIDCYMVGGADDHLMPWQGCYQACLEFQGHHHFVLSTSGHVQSLLRPPRLANAYYFTNTSTEMSAQDWRASCVRREGSWWHHWHAWLNAMSGELKTAPALLGCPTHPPLSAAPGAYVFG